MLLSQSPRRLGRRYVDAEFDRLIEAYLTTISKRERIETLGQVIYRIADQLTIMRKER